MSGGAGHHGGRQAEGAINDDAHEVQVDVDGGDVCVVGPVGPGRRVLFGEGRLTKICSPQALPPVSA